jgi:hypothetical protein
MQRIDFIRGGAAGRVGVWEEIRSDGFRRIYSSRAPIAAQSGA